MGSRAVVKAMHNDGQARSRPGQGVRRRENARMPMPNSRYPAISEKNLRRCRLPELVQQGFLAI